MADNHVPQSAVFARRVRQLRGERGWSQVELGRQLGEHGHKLGQARVAMIEAHGSVTIDQADAIATAFGVPVEVLLYAEPPATKAIRVRQLMRILNAVDRVRDEVRVLVEAIEKEQENAAHIPGR